MAGARLFCLSAVLLGSALLPAGAARAAAQPDELIRSMSDALRTLNYEGTFVRLQGGSVESMHILHSRDRRGELERMVSLNGEAREVVRNHARVTCIWPRSATVVLSKSTPRAALPELDASLTSNQSYELKLGQPDRVAGIDTQVVQVVPKDELRYGYRFWIDQSTGMLLRFMLLDSSGRALEEVMFTDISYPQEIDPQRFDVKINEAQATWLDPAPILERHDGEVDPGRSVGVDDADRVHFEDLPAGYSEVSQTFRSMPIDDGPVNHAMLSDGLASVSVYVEHVAAARQDRSAVGLARMGAMNAFGLSLPEALVTVVGEVPVATVERIARSVRLP